MKNLIEENGGEISIASFVFTSPEEAIAVYESLGSKRQEQMANIYSEAFAGPPWYEKKKCLSCGIFCPGDPCPRCAQEDLPDAYPLDWLRGEYFPAMLSEFSPGILMLAYDEQECVVGFSTGGLTTPENLVTLKYTADESILASLVSTFGVLPGEILFYGNETCIDPAMQNRGIGTRFSRARITCVQEQFNSVPICGRSINVPWLGVAQRDLANAGYSVVIGIPDGDSYTGLDGSPRQFYYAKKNRES